MRKKLFEILVLGAFCLGVSSPLLALTVTSATLNIEADDRFDVYVNGVNIDPTHAIATCYSKGPFYCKSTLTTYNVTPYMTCNNNFIAVTTYDVPGGNSLTGWVLTVHLSDGTYLDIPSDETASGANIATGLSILTYFDGQTSNSCIPFSVAPFGAPCSDACGR